MTEREPMIPCGEQVFVNRTLNLNNIKLVGFDMDYTVATYNVPAFEDAAFRIVIEKLVAHHGWPAEIRSLRFDPEFIIRGLVLDTELGNVLKVNRYGYVKKTSHGLRQLTIEEQKQIYTSPHIDVTDPRYYIVHTLFSLAEGSLFAQLVDFCEREGRSLNVKQMWQQIRRCIDLAHQDGSIKNQIIAEPTRFLIQDRGIVEALLKLKRFGKKLALITNSDYEYSVKVMQHCFDPFLDQPWQDLFDIIVVAANKPAFFQQQLRFLRVDRQTGLLSNLNEPLRWKQIYQGGNAGTFERDLELNPSQILYLGDHLYGDVETLKEAIGWRTGLVVQELAHEIPMLAKHRDSHRELAARMQEKEALEDRLYAMREHHWSSSRERRSAKYEKQRDEIRARIAQIDEAITAIIGREQADHNPRWGEVMRAGNEESRFATLVERYACIYMASIANLRHYSPFKYFRPRRRWLAHDPDPMASGTDED